MHGYTCDCTCDRTRALCANLRYRDIDTLLHPHSSTSSTTHASTSSTSTSSIPHLTPPLPLPLTPPLPPPLTPPLPSPLTGPLPPPITSFLHPHSTMHFLHQSLLLLLHILHPHFSIPLSSTSSTCSTPHSSLLHFLHPSLLHAPSGCGQGHCEAPEGFWEAGPPRNTQP